MAEAWVSKLAQEIQQADAILIGGGSGLSSAAGYNHYHWSDALKEGLEAFWEHYRFKSPFEGFYHCFSDYGAQWGYYAKYSQVMHQAKTGKPYELLREIVGDKPHFVLTTNVDGQFNRVFSPEHIFIYQGDFSYLQCIQPCHDELYPSGPVVEELSAQLQDGVYLSQELVPRCPHCGRVMVPWVRDDTFMEGSAWQEQQSRYRAFLRRWLMEEKGKRLLLLELGVGEMSPGVIKLPFWQIAAANEGVRYVCMNLEKSHAPEHLKDRGMYVQGDLSQTLEQLHTELEKVERNDGTV